VSERLAEPFARLRAALPSVPDAEVILRGDPQRATATLRVAGQPPRVFVATDDGVHETYPAGDVGLPGVELLRDGGALDAALRPHVGAVADSRVVAWRPGRRAVIEVALCDGGTVWLKLLDRKSWRRSERAFAGFAAAPPPVHLCTPAHQLSSHCSYIARPAQGTSLRGLLAAGEMPSLTMLSRAIIGLGFTPTSDDLPVLDFEVARAATIAMLGKAAVVSPWLARLADRIAAMAAPNPTAPGFVHGDLHDKQLFVDDDTVSLIDLEGASVGDPRFDIANLVEHIRLRDLQRSGHDEGLADAMLVRCGLDPDLPAARSYRTLVRARLCGVYSLRPRWRDLVERLTVEVTTLLKELS